MLKMSKMLGLLWGLILFFAAQNSGAENDPAKIMSFEACNECHNHKPNVAAWMQSTHFKTFQDMPRSDKAKEISTKLGIKRIRNEALCQTCHFTVQEVKGEPRAITGISCESCHGAAKDWVEVHSAEGVDHEKRMADAEAKGMLRPSRVYQVAQNCFQCHTVPEENLVNTGGHAVGSDFELVAWSQGEVRHNLLYTEGKENKEASPELKRVLYVTGRLLDLEFSLRALAKATADGVYAQAMAARVTNAKTKLGEIKAKSPIPDVDAALKAVAGAELKPANAAALTAAADQVSASGKKFAENDGSKLAAIDALVPGKDAYKGAVFTP